MSCWRRRLRVALLIWRNAIRSAVEEAAWSAIGQETKASLRQLSQGSSSCGYPHNPFVTVWQNGKLVGMVPPKKLRDRLSGASGV